MKRLMNAACIAAVASVVAVGSAGAGPIIVYANNPAPGDSFTNATGTSSPGAPGAAIGSSGWYYNNVRSGSEVGVQTTLPRTGNASVFFNLAASGGKKADVELFAPLGTLGTLASLGYDWYRDSTSTTSPHYHPALRIYFDADGSANTTNDRGYLVFERAYNPAVSPVPTNEWVTEDVVLANFWMVHFGNPAGSILEIFDRDLWEWTTTSNPNPSYPTLSANTAIIGLSLGVGSGWVGTFRGAVDNVTIGFANAELISYNFEVQSVPEPTTLVLLGLGLAAAGRKLRRR